MDNYEFVAAAEIGHDVKNDSSANEGICKLTEWSSRCISPEDRAVVCDNGNDVYVASRDFCSIERFLKDAKLDLQQLDKALDVIEYVLPQAHCLLTESNVLDVGEGRADPPRFDGNGLVFYCHDWRHGRIIRVEISGDYDVTVTDAGEGEKFYVL